MTVDVSLPHTLDALVDFILQAEVRKTPVADTVSELVARFGMLEGDAELAWDRALGGLVRAATGNPANCPDHGKDPVAWLSYQRCLRDPSLITAIRPDFA